MTPAAAPATLERDGIAARVPHQGRMCLLDRLEAWTARTIRARADGHHAVDHPLRTAGGLLAPCAIEYAAQAMALHGALLAPAGAAPTPGYLASVRGVRFGVERLDDADGPLCIEAERLAGDERQILYRFRVGDAHGALLAEGRATVVLNTALPAPTEDRPA